MLPSATSRNRRDKLPSASSTAVDVLIGVLAQLKEVSDIVPVPYFKVAIVGLYQTVMTVKRRIQNNEDIAELVERVKALQESVVGRLRGEDIMNNAPVIKRIQMFSESVQKISAAIEKVGSRNAVIRLITTADDAQKIVRHFRSLNWVIQSFTNSTVIDIELSLHENTGLMRGDIKELRDDVRRVEDLILEQQYLKCSLLNIPIAPKALYNCDNTRSSCMDNTRTKVLSTVYSWIKSYKNNRASPRIFWLDGLAGSGKSTIAQSVAEYCARKGWLGASFFFSREDSSRSSLRLVFTTIAEQLALFFKPIEPLMREAIKNNPYLAYTSPTNQFEKLILEPLSALTTPFQYPVVIVIDALDECRDDNAISIILRTFSYYVDSFPLLVFITSRPEPNIERGFELPEVQATTRPFLLHHVEPSLVDHDITLYLRNQLGAIDHPSLDTAAWFSPDQLKALVALCEGLFIFASTAVRYIQDPTIGDPKSQLESLLSNSSGIRHVSHASSPYSQLDQLYTQVLRHAFPKSSSKSRLAELRMVLGAIVLVCEPQSALGLSALVGLKSGITEDILKRIQSLISERGKRTQIHIIHASFADFIQSERCFDRELRVDPGVYHAYLATQCFYQMKTLDMDMCKIRTSSILNSEVKDLRARIMRYIPPTLQYACRHWSEHIQHALLSDDLLELLREFSFERSLFWLEVLSLMGSLESAIPALTLAITKSHHHSLTEMLHNLRRFTLEFFGPISAAALHIYFSALPFTPTNSLLHKTFYLGLTAHSVKVVNGVHKMWDLCLCTMEGHSGFVLSVAFSPDGRIIASGSEDFTVRLWDAVTRANVRTLKGHSNTVYSVAFSPDGRVIVSGSRDGTVRVWDAATGANLRKLTGPSHWVASVAFPHEGRFTTSGADDIVRVWDAAIGTNLSTVKGCFDYVRSVALSPDRRVLVSGDYKTVQAWDAAMGTNTKTLKGHSDWVRSVAFSPNGRFIASGSDDNTVRVWDAVTGTNLRNLKGHSSGVYSVAFSLDGRLIVSGSQDRTVRMWDAATGSHLQGFIGHPRPVQSVAFSPDGRYIASGSEDNTVRVWDAVTRTCFENPKDPSDWVRLAAFSPDGRFIVSGSENKTLQVWDVATGTNIKRLIGHSDRVCSVAFSPDGRFIASGSDDNTVRVWDASTGTNLRTLKGHSNSVSSVAFSPDGRLIRSGSVEGTVQVWDAATGSNLKTLKDQTKPVHSSVVFSPGGRFIVPEFSTQSGMWDPVTGNVVDSIAESKPSFTVENDGWVYRRGKGPWQRLCWVPVHCRGYVVRSQDERVVVAIPTGAVVFLDFSACEL